MAPFGTAGIRGSTERVVTPALGVELGLAFGSEADSVVVGRDGRVTGQGLADAVASGLQAAGSDVIRLGQVPTPALAHASQEQGGIMVTASHNPPADNGFKCFLDGAEIDAAMEERLSSRMAEGARPDSWDTWGQTQRMEVLPVYRSGAIQYLRDRFDRIPLAGHRIAIDCGGGMGGLATPTVLEALGASTVTINATIDGSFAARASKPTKESLQPFLRFVHESDVDLGIAHDGDADRLVVVDTSGEICHEDTILAAIAREYVHRAQQTAPTVLTTPNVSARVEQVVSDAGGTVAYGQLGGLIEEISDRDGSSVVFAAEPWKHVHPAFGPWMDAIVSAGFVACLVGREGSLERVCADIPSYPYRKDEVECPDNAKAAVMEHLTAKLTRRYPEATISRVDGFRLQLDEESWLLVRPSGTEPYIRLYGEGAMLDRFQDHLELVARTVENVQ